MRRKNDVFMICCSREGQGVECWWGWCGRKGREEEKKQARQGGKDWLEHGSGVVKNAHALLEISEQTNPVNTKAWEGTEGAGRQATKATQSLLDHCPLPPQHAHLRFETLLVPL